MHQSFAVALEVQLIDPEVVGVLLPGRCDDVDQLLLGVDHEEMRDFESGARYILINSQSPSLILWCQRYLCLSLSTSSLSSALRSTAVSPSETLRI